MTEDYLSTGIVIVRRNNVIIDHIIMKRHDFETVLN